MKKLFGAKKKKKSKPASFNSADSDFQVKDVVPRKLIMSQSTDQPRLTVTNGISSNITLSNTLSNSNSSKGLTHSKSQGIMKTTISTQPAISKRLNRPTSSPPALVMPRPRYAEPPTRAVLKSFEHEKTLLDLDPTNEQKEMPKPMLTEQVDGDNNRHRNIYGNHTTTNLSMTSLTIKPPIPTTTVSTPNRSQKLSPIADTNTSPSYDTKPGVRNKKSLDSGIVAVINAKKHESLNSVTGSDDSNRVYESALESPMMASTSTTTTNLNHHHSHITDESIFGLSQTQRHSSPSALSGTLVPQLIPPTASDSSETVTPAGSTSQHARKIPPEQSNIINAINTIEPIRPAPQYPNSDQASTPASTARQHAPVISPKSSLDKQNGGLQQLRPSQDLESLQQQVLLIQQQREMDRVEYERMEQVHKERTKWMKAEIDRTQSKLLELAASKRACMPSQQQHGDNVFPDGGEGETNDYYNRDGKPRVNKLQREQRQQQYDQFHSSARNTPSRSSQKSAKTGVNAVRLSRSSSKASTGGGSFSGGPSYRSSKGDGFQQPLSHNIVDEQDGIPPTTSGDQPVYTNGTSVGNVSRQSSGRRSQQSQQDRHHRYQQQQLQQIQMQDIPPEMAPSTSRSRPREQRPRSKSTESRMPPPQISMAVENNYYADPHDDMHYGRPPSRPQSNNSRRKYRQRSLSVERPHPYYYDTPYFYPPGVYNDGVNGGGMGDDGAGGGGGEVDMDDADDVDDEHDEDDYRYMDMAFRYQQQQQQQQQYDSFPPRHRQRMRHYYPQYIPGPMNFMPPPMQPSISSGPPLMQPPYSNRQQRMPPPRMNMEMQQQQQQQEFYGFDSPTSYYSGGPLYPRRRQQQQQQQPPSSMLPNDDGYWPGGDGEGQSSFNRYHFPPFMRMDDPQRRAYWRSRPPPSSEYAM